LNAENTSIKIQNDGNKVILTGVREVLVGSTEEVASLLREGEIHRHVGATDMNEKSSRAHTIFKVIIESKDAESTRISTLNLVDLAGSENAKMTNSVGERAREARHINQSLLTLSTIIQRLSDKAMSETRDEGRRISFDKDNYSEAGSDGVSSGSCRPMQHLPYRDSKLTRIMQPSLSDNALVVIICTISPTVKCADESHNTLKFAQRAKRIKTSARINEVIDDKTLLRRASYE
jgi:centromeric protein E